MPAVFHERIGLERSERAAVRQRLPPVQVLQALRTLPIVSIVSLAHFSPCRSASNCVSTSGPGFVSTWLSPQLRGGVCHGPTMGRAGQAALSHGAAWRSCVATSVATANVSAGAHPEGLHRSDLQRFCRGARFRTRDPLTPSPASGVSPGALPVTAHGSRR